MYTKQVNWENKSPFDRIFFSGIFVCVWHIEIKESLMHHGLAKQKCLEKSYKVSEFNVRLPQ